MASPKLSALSAYVQPAVVHYWPHHRSSVSFGAAQHLGGQATDAIKIHWDRGEQDGTMEETSLAQDELLGDDLCPYSIKNSLMGTACKEWAGFDSARIMGSCVSLAQYQCHRWFLGNTGTSLSPSARNEATPAGDTGSLILLVLQNGGRSTPGQCGSRQRGHQGNWNTRAGFPTEATTMGWVSTSQQHCHLPEDLRLSPAPWLAQYPKSGPSWCQWCPAVTS